MAELNQQPGALYPQPGRTPTNRPQQSLWDMVRQAAQRPASYWVGPHLSQGLENVGNVGRGLLNFVGPQADVQDLTRSSAEAMDNFRQGNVGSGLRDTAYAAATIPMMFLPGTVSGIRKSVSGLLDEGGSGAGVERAVAPDRPPTDIYDPPHSRPEYRGAGEDRTPYTHLRYEPEKGASNRVTKSIEALENNTGGLRDQMMKDIDEGLKQGAADWYNTEELRDWFIKELGEEQGHYEWAEFMDLMGATSPHSRVPSNMRIASYYRNKGPQWIADNYDDLVAKKLVPPKGSGFGSLAQKPHATNVARSNAGEWVPNPETGVPPSSGSWTTNPKPKGFTASLMGSITNIAADLHFTRYMAMATKSPEWLSTGTRISASLEKRLLKKYGDDVAQYITHTEPNSAGKFHINFKPQESVQKGPVDIRDFYNEPGVWVDMPNKNEYKAFEDYMNAIGAERGLTGPQVQAALWMGASRQTNVADASQGTFMELFRKAVARRAKETNLTPAETLDNFINWRQTLAVPFGLLGAGGAVAGAGMMSQGGDGALEY